ncbi:MAG: hypothetical protein KIH89_000975 [Candidatus Shapirobacteria bacterium]|nr:hypothetical protein [Candidatus Shapirobacteria bacterium]
MKNIFLFQKGVVNKGFSVVVGMFLLVALPVSVMLVQKNQENRSKAAESEMVDEFVMEEDDGASGACGSANGGNYASRPVYGLCDSGVLFWSDSSGDDGVYDWSCEGDTDETQDVCSAIKLAETDGGSVDGRCGDANNSSYKAVPISDYLLCKSGSLSWVDEAADDGSFNWSCTGANGGYVANCVAAKEIE